MDTETQSSMDMDIQSSMDTESHSTQYGYEEVTHGKETLQQVDYYKEPNTPLINQG